MYPLSLNGDTVSETGVILPPRAKRALVKLKKRNGETRSYLGAS